MRTYRGGGITAESRKPQESAVRRCQRGTAVAPRINPNQTVSLTRAKKKPRLVGPGQEKC
jgi:hypothetical protein